MQTAAPLAIDIVPLGVPGSGKGTVAKLLAAALDIPHLSTGDLLRALDRDCELGRQVFALIDQGNYIPDALAARLVESRLLEADTAQGIILDGFPRTLAQLPLFDQLSARNGREALFIELSCPLAVGAERMLRRGESGDRADDTPAVIARRLEVYSELTLPLVDELARQQRLLRVSALDPPALVAEQMLAARANYTLARSA